VRPSHPILAALLLAAGCATPDVRHATTDARRPAPAPVTVLGTEVDALREAFNAAEDRPRVIALLSPTCPRCAESSEAILRALENAPDGVEPTVFVVWLEVFAVDDADACRDAMGRFAGTPVQGFVDDLRVAGRTLTRGRLPIGVARHLFLWYEPGKTWGSGPPAPTGWGHQLRRHDPETYCPGDVLEQRLGGVFGSIAP
jgi:hypothetical protein